tara:strand:+ start:1060 stop:2490 length:1431 start_codon:yes stop_codon:yes gene_type:complete
MRIYLSSIIVLIVLCSAVVLADSTVEITPINNKIQLADRATFKLSIGNFASQTQKYSIHSVVNGIGWIVEPEPLQDRIMSIPSAGSKSTTIVVTALESFEPGIYRIPLGVRTDLGESYDEQLKIFINPDKPLDYLPAIRTTIDMDEKLVSTESFSASLFLENRNPLNLKDITVRVQSDIPSFQQSVQVDIPPLSDKTVEFTLTPDSSQQPKKYVVFFVLEKDGQTIKVVEKSIEILPYVPGFSVDVTESKVLLKTFKSIEVTNEGNVKNGQQVSIPLNFFESLFTQPWGKRVTVDGEKHLAWELTLSPGESTILPVEVNYRLPVYVLLGLLLVWLLYLFLRSPIKLSKSVMGVKRHEGTLTELKVMLNIRNITGRKFTHVTIVDQLPGIAHIDRALEIGTVKPVKITHSKKGTKVHWQLDHINPRGDRLITYKLKSRLNIVGTLKLPRATLTFHRGRKKRKSFSNTFSVSSKTSSR